jgi:hypothetical protein
MIKSGWTQRTSTPYDSCVQNLFPWLFMGSLLALYAALWFGMLAAIARFGGWSNLARQFRVAALPAGKRFRFQTVSFQQQMPVNYGSCVTLVVCEQGLGLSIGWPFRFRHPPLLIPWSEFRRPEQKRVLWVFRYVLADVGEPVIAKVYLPHWTFAQANLAMAATDDPRGD